MRWILVSALLIAAATGLIFTQARLQAEPAPMPTLMVLPSVTPLTPTATWTPSVTPSPTLTVTTSATATPTLTPTLSERLLSRVVVMPDVVLPAPPPTQHPDRRYIAQPPPLSEPLPDATQSAPPYRGWFRFESDHPIVTYQPAWQPRLHTGASRGQYHRIERTGHMLLQIQADAFRVRYVAAQNMGIFQIVANGVVLDEIDAYQPDLSFRESRIYPLSKDLHTIEIRATGEHHPDSSGATVGFDAIDIYRGPDSVHIGAAPVPPAQPTEHIIDAVRIVATPEQPRDGERRVQVIIAYDENANREVDPAEGVQQVPVRLVDAATNQVIASRWTDPRGYARFTLNDSRALRVVVPYFGRVWDVSRGDGTLIHLIEAGNQPGVIP